MTYDCLIVIDHRKLVLDLLALQEKRIERETGCRPDCYCDISEFCQRSSRLLCKPSLVVLGVRTLDHALLSVRSIRGLLDLPACIVLLDEDVKQAVVHHASEEKINGYLTLQHSLSQSWRIVRSWLDGKGTFTCDPVSDKSFHTPQEYINAFPKPGYFDLSGQEKTLLRLLMKGHDLEHCSEEMKITVKTVDNTKTRLMKKLAVHSATRLLLLGSQFGL